MQVKLAVIDGPHAGKEFLFAERDSFLVGRSKHAHFALPRDDPYFSRKHFIVEVNPPRCRLLDLKSRNGTWVNGERVQAAELRDGDEIKAGHTVLKLSIVGGPPADGPSEARPARPRRPRKAAPTTLPPALDPQGWESIPPEKPAVSPSPQEPTAPRVTPPYTPQLSSAETPSCPTLVQPADIPISFGGLDIPGYEPIKLLGEGAMGVVFLAERRTDQTRIAIKMLKIAPGVGRKQIQRFQREAQILSELRHANIVSFHEAGAVGSHPYIVMEFVNGIDADTALKRNGPLPIPTAVRYTCQLLDALEYAHAKKFVHRDIKPANVLLEEKGEDRVVRLADFGLARVYEASQLSGVTLTGDLGGTIPFMAPEQVTHFRDVGAPADQYSAAASLYFLLTRRFIFDFAEGVNSLIVITTEEPVPLQDRRSDVPLELADAVHRALAKETGERYKDVAAFRQALEAFGR